MRPYAVDSFVIETVKDDRLPEDIPGFTPGIEFIGKLLTRCPSIIDNPGLTRNQDLLPFATSDSAIENLELHQTSPLHRRSFEVHHISIPEHWIDEYGHAYTALTLKGNNFSSPSVHETLM